MQRKEISLSRGPYFILTFTVLFTIVLFLEGFSQTRRFQFSELGSDSFKRYLVTKKVVAIADLHGTNESPEIFLQFAKLFKAEKKKVTVALEINNNYQKNIEQYLKDGDLEKLRKIEFFRYPDGRTSIAMVKLLKQLREMEGIRILCYDYDPNSGSEAERDSLMAVNLSNNCLDEPMLILTGNMHSSLKEGCCGIPGFKSALFRLQKIKKLGDNLISLNASAGEGAFWGCMYEGCKEWDVVAANNVSEDLKGKSFISIYDKEDNIGFNGTIYFDKVTPSYPVEKKD